MCFKLISCFLQPSLNCIISNKAADVSSWRSRYLRLTKTVNTNNYFQIYFFFAGLHSLQPLICGFIKHLTWARDDPFIILSYLLLIWRKIKHPATISPVFSSVSKNGSGKNGKIIGLLNLFKCLNISA